MQGTIVNYRSSRHVQQGNHIIVKVDGLSKREEAEKLVGKKATFALKNGKIEGTVAAAHGNSGAVRVVFERGLPGQAITQKVSFQ